MSDNSTPRNENAPSLARLAEAQAARRLALAYGLMTPDQAARWPLTIIGLDPLEAQIELANLDTLIGEAIARRDTALPAGADDQGSIEDWLG